MGFRNVCLSHATTNNNTWNDTLESWIKHGTTYWIASPLLFMLVPLMRINITCKNIKKHSHNKIDLIPSYLHKFVVVLRETNDSM